jgi:hypothetical protein
MDADENTAPRRLCDACLGNGAIYQPTRKMMWPCPYCVWQPHPRTGPEFIVVRGARK